MNVTNDAGAVITLATSGSGGGTITADTINNNGKLQSFGSMALNPGSLLSDSGSILSNGDLTIRGSQAAAYTATIAGSLQSAGVLSIAGQGGSNAVNVQVNTSGLLLGGSLNLTAQSLTQANTTTVSSIGDMTLNLSSLNFGGSASHIIAASSGTGTANINIATAFTNPGLIFSASNLNLNTPSLNNTTTGGISALGTLQVAATAGDLYNAGQLYAGSQLTASATGTFTNAATLAQPLGSLDSGGSMTLSAGTFINNSNINAAQNIGISATTFRNEILGGDTRQTSLGAGTGNVFLGKNL